MEVKTIVFMGVFALSGLVVEWIGVHTGWLFGDYAYGMNLGPKLIGVPYVIGLNWAMLVMCSASLVQGWKVHVVFKAIAAAGLMTFLDFLMEPVAIKSDFWHWNSPEIPIFNYVCWFLISFVLLAFYFSFGEVKSNKVMNRLFAILLIFFATLNFI
jgi:putative membrane protein